MRLGGDPSLFEPFPAKPKRMHWRTYLRLREQEKTANTLSIARLTAWLLTGVVASCPGSDLLSRRSSRPCRLDRLPDWPDR